MIRTRGAIPEHETSVEMDYTLATIGARIRQFRTQKGLTLQALGRITGQVTTEDLLGAVFSRFCIGK